MNEYSITDTEADLETEDDEVEMTHAELTESMHTYRAQAMDCAINAGKTSSVADRLGAWARCAKLYTVAADRAHALHESEVEKSMLRGARRAARKNAAALAEYERSIATD